MKINAHVVVDGQERVFEISCGLGDKTFKWLAIVACQRFASLAPNGSLRRREDIRGSTEHAQHLPYEIYLPDGELPHPSCILSDFVHDGDSVYVSLMDKQSISKETLSPKATKWSTVAFNNSSDMNKAEEVEEEEEDEEDDNGKTPESIRANANFMRLMLRSQMINTKRISNEVYSTWSAGVDAAMPLLKPEDRRRLRVIIEENWDMTKELYQKFAPDGAMSEENFRTLCEEACIFYSRDCHALSSRTMKRTCHALKKSGNSLTLSEFLVALILASQTRFHDMYEKDIAVLSCVDSLNKLYSVCLLPLGQRLALSAHLKQSFCSDDFLSSVRCYSETLFQIFQKLAGRAGELSSTLCAEHMSDFLVELKIWDEKSVQRSKSLLIDVRSGSIFGREVSEAKEEEQCPEDHYMFPEFVEAISRALFHKNHSTLASSTITQAVVVECYLNGIKAIIDASMTVTKK